MLGRLPFVFGFEDRDAVPVCCGRFSENFFPARSTRREVGKRLAILRSSQWNINEPESRSDLDSSSPATLLLSPPRHGVLSKATIFLSHSDRGLSDIALGTWHQQANAHFKSWIAC
jgi:hypothetical protein